MAHLFLTPSTFHTTHKSVCAQKLPTSISTVQSLTLLDFFCIFRLFFLAFLHALRFVIVVGSEGKIKPRISSTFQQAAPTGLHGSHEEWRAWRWARDMMSVRTKRDRGGAGKCVIKDVTHMHVFSRNKERTPQKSAWFPKFILKCSSKGASAPNLFFHLLSFSPRFSSL